MVGQHNYKVSERVSRNKSLQTSNSLTAAAKYCTKRVTLCLYPHSEFDDRSKQTCYRPLSLNVDTSSKVAIPWILSLGYF